MLVPSMGLEPTTLGTAARPTELAGQLIIGLVPAVFHYSNIKHKINLQQKLTSNVLVGIIHLMTLTINATLAKGLSL